MAELALKTKMTPEEYLEFERASEEKHEYVDGEVYAMSGGTIEHSLISGNIVRELGAALRHQPCVVLTSDMRLKVEATGNYFYPDASVVCGGAALADGKRDNLLNPQVIFEVLSRSSEEYDRGKKFAEYRTIPSLSDYVLVSQTEMKVEHFRRQPDGQWRITVLGAGEQLALDSIGCEISVDELYLKVFSSERGAR